MICFYRNDFNIISKKGSTMLDYYYTIIYNYEMVFL